jgi:hypothetical protein
MKTMAGAAFFASANSSRTREAPTPTNISMNSDPLIEKNATPASPATARASNVLPVPGGPTSSAPRGTLPPKRRNFSGCFRKFTTSSRSCLAALRPATSLKVSETLVSLSKRRLLPLSTPASGPPLTIICCARRDSQIQTPMIRIQGSSVAIS